MASKLKAIDPKKAEPTRPRILVYGAPGVGKTFTSLDFPSPYFLDTEGGANLDHYTSKLKKAKGVYFGPEQGSQDFESIIDQVKALATEDHPYRTLVIDSLTKVYNLEITKEAERLGEKDAFGASKKPATRLTARLISWLNKVDMNVIIICHEKALWADQKQLGTTYDGYDKLAYELDLTLNIVKMGDARKAFVRKSRLLEFPDNTSFDWSYADFAKKYGEGIIEKASEKIILATPAQLEELNKLLGVIKLPDGTEAKWLKAKGVDSWDEMSSESILGAIAHIRKTYLTTEKAA